MGLYKVEKKECFRNLYWLTRASIAEAVATWRVLSWYGLDIKELAYERFKEPKKVRGVTIWAPMRGYIEAADSESMVIVELARTPVGVSGVVTNSPLWAKETLPGLVLQAIGLREPFSRIALWKDFANARDFMFEGSCVGRTSGFPEVVGHYNTVAYGQLDHYLFGAQEVEENGTKWIKVWDSYIGGDAAVPSNYTAVYVPKEKVPIAKRILKLPIKKIKKEIEELKKEIKKQIEEEYQ